VSAVLASLHAACRADGEDSNEIELRAVEARASSQRVGLLAGGIDCVAVAGDGTWFICAGGAVYVRTEAQTEARLLAGHATEKGLRDGEGAQARFSVAFGAAVGPDGSLILADSKNHAIRRVTRSGTVTTLAGGLGRGYADGEGTQARFDRPHGVAVDKCGVIFVCDANNHVVRKLELAACGQWRSSTLAGNRKVSKSFDARLWKMDGVGAAATFSFPRGLALDACGDALIVADSSHHAVRCAFLAIACLPAFWAIAYIPACVQARIHVCVCAFALVCA